MCIQVIPIAIAVMRDACQRSFASNTSPHHPLCRCRHSVQFSLHCAWLLQSYSVDANLSTKKKSQGGRKIICTLPQKYLPPILNLSDILISISSSTTHSTLSCLLWISANFAFKENWANFIQTNSNESWTHIISGTRLRNLILSGELVPKDLSPSSGGADDWKTSFQGRERDSFGNFIPWLGRISQKLRKPAGLFSPRPWVNIIILSSLHQLEALQFYMINYYL